MNTSNALVMALFTSLLATNSSFANHHQEVKSMATQHSHGFEFSREQAVSVTRTASFELNMSSAQALPLFTALGEILWAPGWQPNVLSGDGYNEGTTWLTHHNDSLTYWMVTKYDKASNHAIYSRVTPDVDMGKVEVKLSDNGKGGSVVTVRYDLTGLSLQGNKRLEQHFEQSSYHKMIQEWKSLIESNQFKINQHFGY